MTSVLSKIASLLLASSLQRALDMKDVSSAAACFGTRAGDSKRNPRADVTGNGEVDIRDLVAKAKHFGDHYLSLVQWAVQNNLFA